LATITHTYVKKAIDHMIVVGVSDMALSSDLSATIRTHALGSCVGVTVYDPVAHVGGMLHYMLPSSKDSPDKALANPVMFADTGVPLLFKTCYELGAIKERLVVCAAGGAEVLDDVGRFKVGAHNRTSLRKLFWKNNVLLAAEETGGAASRTLSLCLTTGEVTIHIQRKGKVIWPN